jgi:SAM-dependent methyltransferase
MGVGIANLVQRTLPAALIAILMAGSPEVSAQRKAAEARKLDVPYEPTSHRVVSAMLRLADVKSSDYLVDLGCGDGRIPITAAQRYGVSALCVDLDPQRIREARANAKEAKVEDKVTILEADLFKTDFSKVDVLTLFLWPEVNLRLRDRILDLKPGTRVVSHEHNMGNWRPDAVRRIGADVIYLWHVPARIAGNWLLTVNGKAIDLAIDQRYQTFWGRVVGEGRTRSFSNGHIKGRDVSFSVAVDGQTSRRFTGRLAENGTLEGQGWQAVQKP